MAFERDRLKILQASLISLRTLNHSPQTAGVLLERINQAVQSGDISWDELGTCHKELIDLEKEIFRKSAIRNLLVDWQALEAGKINSLDLLDSFKAVENLLVKGLITYKELAPYNVDDFMKLKSLLRNQVKEQ